MENLIIPSVNLDGMHLDFPSKFTISAFPYLWDDEKNHQICFVSASEWQKAQKRDEYGSMIASADIVLPRDRSLAERAHTQGQSTSRLWPVPFVHQMILDAMYESLKAENPESASKEAQESYRPQKVLISLLSTIEKNNGSIFLLGGSSLTLTKAEKNIRATYPGITIVGSMDGTYRPQEEPALIQAIQKGTPNLILAGSPLPDDECWIPRHMNITRSGIFLYHRPILRWFAGK